MARQVNTLILGGGMVGMLAKFLMPDAHVIDWRKAPPRVRGLAGTKQFGAQYLWEPLEDLPCKKLTVFTTIDGEFPDVQAAVRYKMKIGKPEDLKGSTEQLMEQFKYRTTGYALTDLPGSETWNFDWGVFVNRIDLNENKAYCADGREYQYNRLISTIPLHALRDMTDLGRDIAFTSQAINIKETTIPPTARIPAEDTIHIDYLSDPLIACYRTTDRDGMRHMEWLKGFDHDFGPATKIIKPGKIWPNPRTEQLVESLRHADIYCFGRFARWEPNELLHQTYHSLRIHRHIHDR